MRNTTIESAVNENTPTMTLFTGVGSGGLEVVWKIEIGKLISVDSHSLTSSLAKHTKLELDIVVEVVVVLSGHLVALWGKTSSPVALQIQFPSMHSSVSVSHPAPLTLLQLHKMGHSSISEKNVLIALGLNWYLKVTYLVYEEGFYGTFDVGILNSRHHTHRCLSGNDLDVECSWWEVFLPCTCCNQMPSFIEVKAEGNESSLFSILSHTHIQG